MNQDPRMIAAEALLDLINPVIFPKIICSRCDKTFNTIDQIQNRILLIKHLASDHMKRFSTVHEEENPLDNPAVGLPALPNSLTKNAKSNNSNIILAKTKNQASTGVVNLLFTGNKDKKVELKKVTTSRISLNIHKMPRCKICDVICVSDYSLKSHMTLVHEGKNQTFQEEKKQKSIEVSKDNLDLEMTKIDKEKENLHQENTIQESVHDKEKHQIECNFDAQIIEVKLDLNQSVVSEEKQLNNDNLDVELITIEEEKENLNQKCQKCQAVFHSEESLRRHIYNIDGNCNDQPQNTNSNEERASAAAELSFYCDICNKKFSLKSNLTTHIEIVHEGIKPFQCVVCKKDFSQKTKLKQHFKHHHPDIPLPDIKKKFPCSKCFESFSTEIKLEAHEKKHESNIFCDICNIVFTRTNDVKKHKENFHETSAECLEMKCNHCDFLFDDTVLLRSHVAKVHEGNKL